MLSEILQYKLLAWYETNGRSLPWRIKGRPHHDPYIVWLSEVMLQQTTVQTVIPRFISFLRRWPSIKDLAKEGQGAILESWFGLGYYDRARRLYWCSRMIIHDRGGHFPETVPSLELLPGIGPYTARAIAAIAFSVPVIPVDGNVARIITRFATLSGRSLSRQVQVLASQCQVVVPPYDLAQALMDLGAIVCRVKKPLCSSCPLVESCLSAPKLMTSLHATRP